MPVSATASAIAIVEIFAASYFTCSRRPMRSAEKSSRPLRVLNRRSRMATSSRQSIPSILKVDSACSSQTVQVAVMRPSPASRRTQPCASWRRARRGERVEEPDAGEQGEVMGEGGLAEPEELGEVADRHLGPGERVEDAHARGIPQDFEGLRQGRRRRVVQEAGLQLNI